MKAINKYTQLRFKETYRQLKYFSKTRQPEAMHQLRVELKKLHAVYLLIGFCDKTFDTNKQFKSLRKLTQTSSPLRDAAVINQLFEKYKVELQINDALIYTEKQERHINSFCKAIPTYLKSIYKAEKKLKKHLKMVNEKCIKEFIIKSNEDIRKQIHSRTFEKYLHPLRITIKQLLYVAQINQGLSKMKYEQYDALQNAIGDWHNTTILHNFLKGLSFEKKYVVIKRLQNEIEKFPATIK